MSSYVGDGVHNIQNTRNGMQRDFLIYSFVNARGAVMTELELIEVSTPFEKVVSDPYLNFIIT